MCCTLNMRSLNISLNMLFAKLAGAIMYVSSRPYLHSFVPPVSSLGLFVLLWSELYHIILLLAYSNCFVFPRFLLPTSLTITVTPAPIKTYIQQQQEHATDGLISPGLQGSWPQHWVWDYMTCKSLDFGPFRVNDLCQAGSEGAALSKWLLRVWVMVLCYLSAPDSDRNNPSKGASYSGLDSA